MGYPKSSDGRQILLNSKYRGDWLGWYPGADDSGGTKGEGDLFAVSHTGPGEMSEFEFQFGDPVYVGGGFARYQGAKIGDWFGFRIMAPATTVTSNPGAGALQIVGGAYVPHPTSEGDYDLSEDGADSVPIPVGSGHAAGFWTYEQPDTGVAVPVLSMDGGGNPTGDHILLSVDQNIVKWVPRIPMLGDATLDLRMAIKPKKIYPQWVGRVRLYVSAAHTVDFIWALETSRKSTV